jgi:predicted DNA-binding protein
MKKDALLSFKCTQEMKGTIERLAKEGDRSTSMQLIKIIREWIEEHTPPSGATKPPKSKKA